MSIPFYLIGTLLAAGIYLNKKGKQPRNLEKQRQFIEDEEKPSDKNIYHSERYYDVWNKEFELATKNWIKSRDPVNNNIIPRYYNEMQTNQEISPELQSYIEKRGSRLKYYQEKTEKKNMINEGGNEMAVQDSPMFNVFGKDTNKEPFLNLDSEDARQQMENFTVTNRSGNDSGGTGVCPATKQEHFGMYTLHGPRNSNNPMVHNNMVPFFKGHVKQNVDMYANQTIMENFTGQTNAPTEFRSQPKREIPSLQDRTPGQTYIYGTPADNVYQRDRYWTSTLKTDITPIEQVRVGKGISGTYDWKPQDGFHTMWRPPYRNVDEIRVNPKNTYEGRLNPGEELVKNRGVEGQVFKHRPDTFSINDPRRWFKTTGSYTAPQVRENFVANKQNREDTSIAYTGIAGQTSTDGPYTGICIEGGSDQDNGCAECPPLVTQAKHTDRNQLPSFGPYRNVGSGQTIKEQKYLYDEAKPTIKESTHVIDYMGQVGNEQTLKQQKYLYDEAKPTTKQSTHVLDYVGQVGDKANLKNQKYYYDEAKPTIKQSTHVMGYVGQVGEKANLKNQKYLDDEAKPTIKQSTHVMGYVGQVGNESTLKNQKYLDDEAKPTIKQSTHVMGYVGQIGTESTLKNQKYLYDEAKPTTKQTTHVMGYVGQVGTESTLKNQKYLYDEAKPTTKQTTHVLGYVGQVGEKANIKNQKYLYDEAKPTTKQTTHVIDYMGQVGTEQTLKQQKYLYDEAKPTTKQTTHVIDYMGQVGTEQTLKQQKYLYDQAKPTTKQTTHIMDYMGQAGSEQTLKQQKYLYDEARPTTKQTTYVLDYMGQAGTSQITIPTSYESMYNATSNNNQEQLLESRAYGPNKNTNISVGACDVNIQIKQRAGYDITKWGPNETRLYTAIPNIGENYQRTTSNNQRDIAGVRQPEDFVVEQFNRNPYTQSLSSAPRVTSPFVRAETPFENI